jgi:hypothetical protein
MTDVISENATEGIDYPAADLRESNREEPSEYVGPGRMSRVRDFARRHRVLVGGLTAGLLLFAITRLARSERAIATTHKLRERGRTVAHRVTPEVKRRTQAVVQAARGDISAEPEMRRRLRAVVQAARGKLEPSGADVDFRID